MVKGSRRVTCKSFFSPTSQPKGAAQGSVLRSSTVSFRNITDASTPLQISLAVLNSLLSCRLTANYSMSNSILIVDDEPGIRDTLKSVLEDEGFVVDTVDSGEACIEQ